MSAISGAALTTEQLTDPSATSTPSRYSELNSEEFIRIIFTELQNQDPLQPSDTKALLEQLNSIRQIESDLELTSNIQALVTENQLSTAGGLIGTYVTGRTNDFNAAEGWVVSAARRGDEIMLGLDDGSEVSIANIQEVVDPSRFPDSPAPATG